MSDSPELNRVLSYPMLTLYGVGTTVGAGIYALIGKVGGEAGMWAPASFVLAASIASLTALSFCELSARLPRAGGEAVYVGEGFRSPRAAIIVGLLVAAAGCISAATVSRAFAGYVADIVPVVPWLAVLALVLMLGGIAAWGIRESAWAAATMTVIEVAGLAIVIYAGRGSLGELPARWPELIPPLEPEAWLSIGGASLLCFYAFLGFEDMVNVAEEVKDVQTVLPRAILTTLLVTVLIYLTLTIVVVFSLPPEELAASEAPLSDLYRHLTNRSATWLSVVGVLAMTNGALIQVIKASRILYGLARQGQIPAIFARVSPRRQTPGIATVAVTLITLVLALSLPTARLAEATSIVTLGVFSLANLALVRLKLRTGPVEGVLDVPLPVPIAGCVLSAGLMVFELLRRL
jgi:amino acid transporter